MGLFQKYINREKNKITVSEVSAMVKKYAQVIVCAFLFFLVAVFPFYAPEGYVSIGTHKYYFFRSISYVLVAALVPVAIFFAATFWKNKGKKRFSPTDYGVLFYSVIVVISYCGSMWKREAFYGTDGWYMGLVSQLLFVAIYFAVSRFAVNIKGWYYVFLAASFVVFLLGLLNRFSIYPIKMEGANSGFISTLGNINWFCSYWMVVFPIGMVMYWNKEADRPWKKCLLALYLAVGFMTGIVQGSSSGFLSLAVVFFVMFLFSFRDGEKLLRFLEETMIFSGSLLVLSVLRNTFPKQMNYENDIINMLTKYGTGLLILSVTVCVYAVVHFAIRKKQVSIKKLHIVQKAVLVAAVIFVCVVLVQLPGMITDKSWGNGRGMTWWAGVQAYKTMMPMQKLIGAGPDCFYAYVYSNVDIALEVRGMFGDARLTNAHNEWLTVLVNTGMWGLLFYATIFVSAIARQLKKAAEAESLLFVSAICILSYTVHNMISFQQVICTPIVFVLLAFGEYLNKTT